MIYLTNGNMPLNAAYADEIVQENNSTYQLTFRFPTSDSLWEQLKEETFLKADDLHGEQDFVIFEVEKKHGYIQVYANQVFTLLNNYVVNPLSLDRQTGSTALSRFAASITRDNPFSFFSDIEDRHTFNVGFKNAMEAFAKDKHSIIGQWGGDLVRHGYQVRLLKNGGSENESLFMYKKNLSSYRHKNSTKSLKTRITFMTTVKGEREKAPDRKFSVVVDSPLINKYSQIYEDVIEVNDQDVKDEASLRKYGEQYYRTSLCDMMEDSLELEVVGQSDVPVQMFDIVSLFHEVYNLDVRKKITKYTYSPMGKKLKTIGFGQFKSGLANAIGNAVSDAVKGETQQLQSDFERQLARELKNADLAFDRKTEELKNEFEDGLNATRAKAEEVKREISDTITQRFDSFDNAAIQEAKRKAEEALRNAGASSLLAQEAKRIGLDSVAKLEEFKRQATSSQTALSGDLDALKRTVTSEVNQASEHRRTTTEALSRMTGQMNGFATKSEVRQDVAGLTETFAKLKTDTNNLISGAKSEITLAKTEFKKTADGLSAKMSAVESYVGQDGQRQEALRRYTREESARQATAVREQISKDYVGKNTFQESVQGVERRLESLSLGTSGNLLKNSNDGFYNQHDKRYRLVETLQANQTYTLVTKYWHGENSTNHTFYDGVGKWQRLNYNKAIDAWMVQFTPTQEIPAGTEIILSAVPNDAKGNMNWATLVRGTIPLIHWQPAKGDVEEGVTQKLAEYKETVDGRFATISSQLNGKANQNDFQRVKETSQLYERILGGSGSSDQTIKDNVARLVMTNQLFQTEVGKYSGNGVNRAVNTTSDWGPFTSHSGNDGVNLHADLHKILSSGFKAGDNVHVRMEISIDGVQRFNDKQIVAILQSYGDVTNWARAGRTFDYNIGTLQPGNNWRLIEFDTVMTDEMMKNNNWMLNLRVDGARSYKVHTKSVKVEKGNVASAWSPAPEDTDEAIRTVQSQLAGSWSIQNINSAGDLISGINLGANGQNRITGKLTHITGETLIDKAVIKSAMIDKLKTANFEAGSVTTTILDAEAVTADKIRVDQALFNKLVANEAYLSQLFAKQAFINRVQSVAIDASQVRSGILSGDRIYGGTIRGANIFGGTLTGHTKIQLGSYGSFDTVNGGLQINVPRDYNAKDGLGVQFIGSYGRGENVPYGLFIYKDSDFTTGGYASRSDDFLLTVEGYIKANGIGWFKTGKGSIGGSSTATLGYWNSNVTLDFGGSGNDIYYSYKGKAYSLWTIVDKHFSDRRLKENIVDCKHKALDYIQQFQFKEYDWKKQEDRPRQEHTKIGLIAQEVQTVDPTLVYENGDTLNLDNLRLTNIALKAIQELALENQKLTHRLENLENERRTA